MLGWWLGLGLRLHHSGHSKRMADSWYPYGGIAGSGPCALCLLVRLAHTPKCISKDSWLFLFTSPSLSLSHSPSLPLPLIWMQRCDFHSALQHSPFNPDPWPLDPLSLSFNSFALHLGNPKERLITKAEALHSPFNWFVIKHSFIKGQHY